jgi:hypothetical protein
MRAKTEKKTGGRQLLHLVFGGELTALDKIEFNNLKALDIVGIFPNYAQACDAWRDASQSHVDDAHMRYFSSCICTGCSTRKRRAVGRPPNRHASRFRLKAPKFHMLEGDGVAALSPNRHKPRGSA